MKKRKPTENEILEQFCKDNEKVIQDFAVELAKIHIEFSENRPSYAEMIKKKNGNRNPQSQL